MSRLARLTSRGPDWAEGQHSGEASLQISGYVEFYFTNVSNVQLSLIAVIIIIVDHKVDVVRVMLQPVEDLVPGGHLAPQGQVPVCRAPARPHKALNV